tara:strand:- start:15081 stop:15263 length:183 start_codon:yes stop_codon:yes gene_type:complete
MRNSHTIQIHKDNDYPHHDKILIPVLFSLTDEGERVYDVELMHEILRDYIEGIIEHEKVY